MLPVKLLLLIFYFKNSLCFHISNSDGDKTNKVDWNLTITDEECFYWPGDRGQMNEYCYNTYTYVYRIKASYEYNVASTVSVCLEDQNTYQCSYTSTWNVNIVNTWTCGEYFKDGSECKTSSLTAEPLIASANNAYFNISYNVTQSPVLSTVPECVCKNWYVTVTNENDQECYSGVVDCNSFNDIPLLPNNNLNKYYKINAQLYSERK